MVIKSYDIQNNETTSLLPSLCIFIYNHKIQIRASQIIINKNSIYYTCKLCNGEFQFPYTCISRLTMLTNNIGSFRTLANIHSLDIHLVLLGFTLSCIPKQIFTSKSCLAFISSRPYVSLVKIWTNLPYTYIYIHNRGGSRGGGRAPPPLESLGIDFYSGFRKKIQVYIHFYSGFRGKKHKGGGAIRNPKKSRYTYRLL